MSALIPTPVLLNDLLDEASLINAMNDGIETQEVSPRTKAVECIAVAVTDDPFGANGIWEQKNYCGGDGGVAAGVSSEWVRSGTKNGNNKFIAYTGPLVTPIVVSQVINTAVALPLV